jgi:hypothetical protein
VHFPKEGKVLEWEVADFHKRFRAGYCTTMHKAQGENIFEHTAIWESDRMPRRMLNTALSRNTYAEHIHLGVLPRGFVGRRKQAILDAIDTKLAGYKSSDAAKGRPLCDITRAQCYSLLMKADSRCEHCGEEMLLHGWGDDAKRKQWTLDRINWRAHPGQREAGAPMLQRKPQVQRLRW